MYRIVLIRHGQSEWNLQNRFTGWTDVDLTDKGREEARLGGENLRAGGFPFDVAYTSFLKRAVRTLWIVQEQMDAMHLPVRTSWRLNERHYGALQGLNKSEMAEKHGQEQVHIWRRSYDVPPPSLEPSDERFPGNDPLYESIERHHLPATESLKDTVNRFLPLWHSEIAPDILAGKRVLIVAHGNSLRALVKYLERMSDEAITGLNIPTGIPLVYDLDWELKPIRSYYLGENPD